LTSSQYGFTLFQTLCQDDSLRFEVGDEEVCGLLTNGLTYLGVSDRVHDNLHGNQTSLGPESIFRHLFLDDLTVLVQFLVDCDQRI